MNVIQRGITTLVRSAITGEALSLPEGFDLEAAFSSIKKHGIVTLIYDGAVKCGINKDLPVMQQMFKIYLQQLLHSESQMQALQNLCAAMDARGFDHLLLKGSVIKSLYPKPELRPMGDADILIRKKQYKAIRSLMEELGYRQTAQGYYDYGWKAPSLYVELHHCLSNPYNDDFNNYLGNGWKRANKAPSGRGLFEYSPEDHFVYLFVHFTKHYRDGGIGSKHAVDLWVYHRAYPNMDQDYLHRAFESMGLDAFYRNIMQMLKVWFCDAPEDEKSAFLTDVIFESSAFSNAEMVKRAVALRARNKAGSAKRAKIWRYFRLAFPTRVDMQPKYPILKNAPWLLPILWIVRGFDALILRRGTVRMQRERINETSDETVESYREVLRYVGLEYTIKD